MGNHPEMTLEKARNSQSNSERRCAETRSWQKSWEFLCGTKHQTVGFGVVSTGAPVRVNAKLTHMSLAALYHYA